MEWLLGLTGLSLGAIWFFGGMKILDVLSPLLKGISELVADAAKRIWSGFKWMLGSSDGIIFCIALSCLVWMLKTCPDVQCPKQAPVAKSVVGKTSPSTNPGDTFLDWFRLH